MSFINHALKEIHCKVIFWGPSLGGKTTNMRQLYEIFKRSNQDAETLSLKDLPSNIERTLFFDFLPVNMKSIGGYKTRFHLYTVPGQVSLEETRHIVARGCDGVVFVADSQAERLEENLYALNDLKEVLKEQQLSFKKLPLVFQYNKRDLPTALPVSELSLKLNQYGAKEVEACAFKAEGVLESLKEVLNLVNMELKTGQWIQESKSERNSEPSANF